MRGWRINEITGSIFSRARRANLYSAKETYLPVGIQWLEDVRTCPDPSWRAPAGDARASLAFFSMAATGRQCGVLEQTLLNSTVRWSSTYPSSTPRCRMECRTSDHTERMSPLLASPFRGGGGGRSGMPSHHIIVEAIPLHCFLPPAQAAMYQPVQLPPDLLATSV